MMTFKCPLPIACMRYLRYFILFVSIVSCTSRLDKNSFSNNNNDSLVRDSTDINDIMGSNYKSAYQVDYIPVDTNIHTDLIDLNYSEAIGAHLKDWVKYYSRRIPNFNLTDFENYKTEVIHPYQEPLGDKDFQKRFFDLYNPYLKWSKDSIKVLDIFSYKAVLDFDSLGNRTGMWDVDCQIALINLQLKKNLKLMQFGSLSEFQDAFWINKDLVLITYAEMNTDELYFPYYVVIDLNNYLTRYYRNSKIKGLQKMEYLDNVFKDVKFE